MSDAEENTLLAVVILLVCAAFSGGCYIGRDNLKYNAIKAGVAKYHQPDEKESDTEFIWITNVIWKTQEVRVLWPTTNAANYSSSTGLIWFITPSSSSINKQITHPSYGLTKHTSTT